MTKSFDNNQEEQEDKHSTEIANEAKKTTDKEHHSQDTRKTKRLEITRLVIILCFISLAVLAVIFVIDLILFKQKIYSEPVFIILSATISTTLTTALGAIIGSSID